jgi:hypothetical protein
LSITTAAAIVARNLRVFKTGAPTSTCGPDESPELFTGAGFDLHRLRGSD